MTKIIKWTIIVLGCLAVLAFVGFQFMLARTKAHSPQETVTYNQGDLLVSVAYSRPYKKDRAIFGELLPYGEVWRTGANEATVFTTSQDLRIDGQPLPAGTYTLWTIPTTRQWTVLFNEKSYDWGLNFDGTSPHDPAADVVSVDVPVQAPTTPIEQFTIRFTQSPLAMALEWDDAQVSVPMQLTN
jgi:hypothetical protein